MDIQKRNVSQDKGKNYLNRKTMRKNKRKELKQKKDLFFRNKNNNKKFNSNGEITENKKNFRFFNNLNNQQNISHKFKKFKQYNKDFSNPENEEKFMDDSEDEEINSEIASENENFDDMDSNENLDENNLVSEDITRSQDDDLEKEIKLLEKKLGLKDTKKYDKFKKKVAMENYDEDLFDFLDNIKKINVEVTKKGENSENQKIQKQKAKNSKQKIQIEDKMRDEDIKIEKDIEKLEEIEDFLEPKKVAEKPQSKLFSNSKFSEEDKFKMKFQKEITSLLNKISEANLNLMFPDFIKKLDQFDSENTNTIKMPNHTKLLFLYDTITKISLRMNLDQEITNLPITSCICSYISILHYKYGNSFMVYFIKSLFERVDEFFSLKEGETSDNIKKSLSRPKSTFKNFIFTLIHFYIFGNLNSKIFYEIIKHFIENFNEIYSEMLLILLSYVGIEIRKEDPESLKEIISNITKKYNLMKINSGNETMAGKIKYIVDMIEEIKNNKYMKFNLSEKFNFFKNFVNTNKKNFISEKEYNLKSGNIADKIEISWISLKNLDKNKISDFIQNQNNDENKSEKLNINEILLENELNDFDEFNIDNAVLEKKLKKFKITTDLKKKIFISIASSSDCNDAFERLNRLNLKKDQAREIIKIIVLLANEEKCYNPFYRMLLSKLTATEKDHKYTFHYTVWDYLKIMNKETFSPKKIHNMSKLVAELLTDEKISLPVFLPFEFENANDYQKKFLVMTFDHYFQSNGNPDKSKLLFAKLVKNDDHVEFGKRLFTFLVKNFKNEVKIDEKSQEYTDCYSSALRVLKRIL